MGVFILSLFAVAGAAPAVAPQKAPEPKVATQAARLYDFKGVPLEITYDEFRNLPHPDGVPARVACTGEKRQITKTYASEISQTSVYNEVEKSLGVKKCVWVRTEGSYGLGEPQGLDLAGSGYSAYNYSFAFVPDPRDGTLRLYQIEALSNRNAADDVITALTKKFGTPKIDKGSVQNKMGASFEQITALWSNPLSSIFVQDRFTKIDDMVILINSERLNKVVSEEKDKKKSEKPNPI